MPRRETEREKEEREREKDEQEGNGTRRETNETGKRPSTCIGALRIGRGLSWPRFPVLVRAGIYTLLALSCTLVPLVLQHVRAEGRVEQPGRREPNASASNRFLIQGRCHCSSLSTPPLTLVFLLLSYFFIGCVSTAPISPFSFSPPPFSVRQSTRDEELF